MIIGGGSLAVLGLILGEVKQLPAAVTIGAAGAFLYLLLVGSLLGFVAFNWLLRHVTAAQAGTYAYVNPLVAVLIGWIDGEDLDRWIIGGICVILTGVALVRGGARVASPTPPPTVDPIEREPWADAEADSHARIHSTPRSGVERNESGEVHCQSS
jgi:hypothetical protein